MWDYAFPEQATVPQIAKTRILKIVGRLAKEYGGGSPLRMALEYGIISQPFFDSLPPEQRALGDLHILNRQQGTVRIIRTPDIFHATGVNYIAAEAIVLIQHSARDWYQFSLAGQFLDAEKWKRDQETENIKAQQGVAPYSAQGALSGER